MKQIVTPFGTFLTDEMLADAICRYSRALARVHDSAFVEIPYRDAHGLVRRVVLRVGWLVSLDVASSTLVAEKVDADVIATEIIRWSEEVERREVIGSSNPYDPIDGKAAR